MCFSKKHIPSLPRIHTCFILLLHLLLLLWRRSNHKKFPIHHIIQRTKQQTFLCVYFFVVFSRFPLNYYLSLCTVFTNRKPCYCHCCCCCCSYWKTFLTNFPIPWISSHSHILMWYVIDKIYLINKMYFIAISKCTPFPIPMISSHSHTLIEYPLPKVKKQSIRLSINSIYVCIYFDMMMTWGTYKSRAHKNVDLNNLEIIIIIVRLKLLEIVILEGV